MGWSSGGEILEIIIKTLKASGLKERVDVYKPIIQAFLQQDYDTMDDLLGIDAQFDEAYFDA